MKRVTGLGGVFIKCRDVKTMETWYKRHLGIPLAEWGAQFFWDAGRGDDPEPYSVFSLFKMESNYFEPSNAPYMINFRVHDLDALIPVLRDEGVTIVGDVVSEPYGKFAWVLDPEGNKIELWEPAS